MIILNLIVSTNEQIDDILSCILKNNFALHAVAGGAIDSYHLTQSGIKMRTVAYTIQFATKSLLFEEIVASLQKEFPCSEFYMYANPIVYINAPYYDHIKNYVTGINLKDIEKEVTNK